MTAQSSCSLQKRRKLAMENSHCAECQQCLTWVGSRANNLQMRPENLPGIDLHFTEIGSPGGRKLQQWLYKLLRYLSSPNPTHFKDFALILRDFLTQSLQS